MPIYAYKQRDGILSVFFFFLFFLKASSIPKEKTIQTAKKNDTFVNQELKLSLRNSESKMKFTNQITGEEILFE